VILPKSVVSLFNYFTSSCWVKNIRKVLCLFDMQQFERFEKHKMRLFSFQKSFKVEEIVETIKVTWWRWFLVTKKGGPFMYFEWFSNPLLCLTSKFEGIVSVGRVPLVLFSSCGLSIICTSLHRSINFVKKNHHTIQPKYFKFAKKSISHKSIQ